MDFKRLGFVLLAGFLALTFLDLHFTSVAFDTIVTVTLQSSLPRFLDIPFSFFSVLGNFEVTSLILLSIALWVWRLNRKIFFSLVFFGMILVFEFIGKIFLYHPGPPSEFFRYFLPFTFPAVHVGTSYSYPSGHVARTIFLVIVAIFARFPTKAFTGVWIVIAVIMVISRIYLGEHWASDVIGGVLLGGSMGFLTISYYEHRD